MTLSLLYITVLFGLSIEAYIICLIIAMATFFFSRWVLKRFIKNDRNRKFTAVILALVATPLIYAGLIGLLIFWISYTPSRGFDKVEWQTDKQSRFQMADDIINSKMLLDKDTTELKQILGAPTWRHAPQNAWTYDMGMGGGGFGFLFHSLHLKFDNNRVVSVEHQEIKD